MKKSVAIIALLVWPLYLNDLYLMALDNTRIGLLWALDVVFFLLIPTTTLVCLVRADRISLREIGFAKPPQPISIIAGIALCGILVVLDQWTLFPLLNQLPGRLFIGYDFPASQPLRILTMIYAALTAGLLEEIVYRGVVTTELKKHVRSPAGVVLLSCLIFAGIHWSEGPGKSISTSFWAIIPTIWVLKRRSLWGPIVCHALYDFLIFTRMV